MSVKLGESNFQKIISETSQLVLVDFYSDSCIPCKRLSPLLAELEETYPDQLLVGKVNVLFEAKLVEEYEVISAPTVFLIKNGEIKEKI
ncbi:MAG: thioredoxin domain-containing protein, partial [Anaerostipes faecalis]|nr:thioredoxin domain-containing protein [Anaerostipes faecalis]